jgi:hypothetical protein
MSTNASDRDSNRAGDTFRKRDDPQYVDALEEDKAITGQRFVCMSFVSPEDILKKREMFYFENFVKHWDFAKSMEKYVQFMNFISQKHGMSFDGLIEDLKEFTDSEKDSLLQNGVEGEYKTFLEQHEEKLNDEFGRRHQFQTSVRGIKVRGVYPTIEEAELRCRMIRDVDPHFDVYVGQVGVWVPFHPDAYKTGRVEYLEEELNQLMHEKLKNEKSAKHEFDKRVKESKRKAIEENIQLATDNNNRLTQTIDEEGNLVGIKNANTQEAALERLKGSGEEITIDEVKRELFEGENIMPAKDGTRTHAPPSRFVSSTFV